LNQPRQWIFGEWDVGKFATIPMSPQHWLCVWAQAPNSKRWLHPILEAQQFMTVLDDAGNRVLGPTISGEGFHFRIEAPFTIRYYLIKNDGIERCQPA
jgi:hypothetical protein